MKVTATAIPEIRILEPDVFGDSRGFFIESFNQQRFDEVMCRRVSFVQDNHSRSARHVLRGLHYQVGAHAQGKLVRVTHGAVFDVAVDLRRSSPTCGRWVGVELSADNKRQLWIEAGFAHGFLVLSESADLLYKTTDYYSPSHDRCLAWNDTTVGIDWPLAGAQPILSAKDLAGKPLREAEFYP